MAITVAVTVRCIFLLMYLLIQAVKNLLQFDCQVLVHAKLLQTDWCFKEVNFKYRNKSGTTNIKDMKAILQKNFEK